VADHDKSPGVTYLAEFATADEMRSALETLRAKGYTHLETYSPYPVSGTAPLLGLRRSRLPVAVFAVGLLGAAVSYWVQWYANASAYPLNIGGRPAHAVPAFIVPTFEGTILSAALAAFVGLLAVLRLPRLWKPVFEIDGFERATVDRFWVSVDGRDRRAAADLTPRELWALEPLRVVRLEEGV
jgi:hypothetical protein